VCEGEGEGEQMWGRVDQGKVVCAGAVAHMSCAVGYLARSLVSMFISAGGLRFVSRRSMFAVFQLWRLALTDCCAYGIVWCSKLFGITHSCALKVRICAVSKGFVIHVLLLMFSLSQRGLRRAVSLLISTVV
jgi:hypothetical protein